MIWDFCATRLFLFFLMEFVHFLPWNESEKARLSWYWISIQGQLVCGKKKNYLEIRAFGETFIPFEIYWYITSNHITCQITQCLCRRPKAGSIRSLTQYRLAVFEWSWRRRERNWKILTPYGDGRNGSSQHQRERGLSCFVWWAERLDGGLEQRCIPSPINKPPKTNSSTPQRRRWDSETRSEGRQVSRKNDIYDRGHWETSCNR